MSTALHQQDEDIWADFEGLRHSIKSNTVDRLKQIITGLAEECGASLLKTGKKQELIDRITATLDEYRFRVQADQWRRARDVIQRVRTVGMYTSPAPSRTFAAHPDFASNNAHGSGYMPPRPTIHPHHAGNNVSGSSIPRFDVYAPPRRPTLTPSASTPPRPSIPVRFKASPFYRIDQAVSNVVECPESSNSMDRRTQSLQFSLNQEQANKLHESGSKYQLRLYCTTNTFYNSSPSAFRTNIQPCPIEFPATCEVRVNNLILQANLKGIKKKPGTAPPADLSKTAKLAAGVPNRIEMVYVNSQTNTGPKKFYLIVYLVEVSTVDQLVDRLRKGKFRTLDEVKARTANVSGPEDDEIVAGKQKMSLKCPLSYTRIKEPCRSDACVHPQCFDAYSWYSVMEQTTTWLCPVCEKVLNPEDLIIDGYFHSILDHTPESVEEVEVEPDGEWHTADKRYGSKAWMEAHRQDAAEKLGNDNKNILPTHTSNQDLARASVSESQSQKLTPARRAGDVVVLDTDSEDEDESRVKRELSPSTPLASSLSATRNGTSSSLGSSEAAVSAVIDLTLDSDDEARPMPPSTSTAKRKISDITDETEATYKKSRATDTMLNASKAIANGYGATTTSLQPPPLRRQTSSSSQRSIRSPSASVGPYYTHHSPGSSSAPTPRYDHFLPYSPGSTPASLPYNYGLSIGGASPPPPPHANRQGHSASAYPSYAAGPHVSNGNRSPWR